MHEIVKDLSTKGFSNEEFQRALPSIITSLKTAITTTRYWQSKLADVQNKPAKIDLIKTHLDDYSRMTKEHVDAVLKKYLVPEKALPILILPKRP
jgi:Zn-dependent M16 (insulinase) family peptidase